MREDGKYIRWVPSEIDLEGLDPLKARQLIEKCFREAQKETIVRAKKRLGFSAGDQDIRDSVESIVRMAFLEIGADYEQPAVEDLLKVIDILAKKSITFGTPEDIISHHKGEIQKILTRLGS
jgi:hypothetical protein